MAFVLNDRVMETTVTTGTGTVTLAGPSVQYQSFAVGIGTGNTTYYTLVSGDGTNWETGLGTVGGSSGAYTLARTTIISSSNSNAAISLTGTSTVICSLPASKAAALPAALTQLAFSTTSVTIFGTAGFFPSTATLAFPVGSLCLLGARIRRAATTQNLVIGLSKDGVSGYQLSAQNDGNLVMYRTVTGSSTVLAASNSGGAGGYGTAHHYTSVSLIRMFVTAFAASSNVLWGFKDGQGVYDAQDTSFDLTTGAWTVYVQAAAVSDVLSVVANFAPESF